MSDPETVLKKLLAAGHVPEAFQGMALKAMGRDDLQALANQRRADAERLLIKSIPDAELIPISAKDSRVILNALETAFFVTGITAEQELSMGYLRSVLLMVANERMGA